MQPFLGRCSLADNVKHHSRDFSGIVSRYLHTAQFLICTKQRNDKYRVQTPGFSIKTLLGWQLLCYRTVKTNKINHRGQR